jgi:hypothetical protein
LLDCILAAASDLGSSNATIAEIIGSNDVGILISEIPLGRWVRLADALDAAVETEIRSAKELRDKKDNSLGQRLSRRALLSNSDKAAQREKHAEVFRLRAQRFVQRCHPLMRQERRCVPKNVAVPLQVKRVNLLRFHMGRFR